MRRWVEEGVEGLEDWPHGRPPGVRKVDLKAIDAVRRLQQNPNLGAFRVHAALAQIGVHLSPRTCGRILATNRALYGLSSRRWTNLVLSNHVPELSSRAGDPGLGERVLRVFNSAETGYEKPHPEAYRRVLRTLGDEVEAVRRVIRTGREEVGVPELCFSHGDQQNPPKLSQQMPGRCLYVEANRNPGGHMATNTRIPKAELTGIKGALIKRMATKTMGQVPTPLGVYWHNPKVLKASFAIGKKVQKWDQCDENLKSFAHMAVASLVGCTWCLDFNYFQAHNENLDLEKAREVPRWRESDVFTPLERDVMAYAEAMSQTPPTVTDELAARLLEQLGAAALVELTAVISFANFTTRGNVALGIESDGFAEACDLKPLAVPTARPGVASAS